MIAEKLTQVMRNIEIAKGNRNRYFDENVKLIAVTKNHDVNAMREAIDHGVKFVGENRIQEAMQKVETLNRSVEWHLIGHLQTNKAKYAVDLFDLIHSIDSERLMAEVNRVANKINKIQKVLLQVNVSEEKNKFGISTKEIEPFLDSVGQYDHIHLCGLMTIAPHYNNVEDARPIFRELFQIFCNLKLKRFKNVSMDWLSMGMTNDYMVAIEEGANLIRVGTGIFGQRQY
ncbi:YggS family pyridoxal phosphate-dependent enzyme [Anaerosinus sp.]|uniref:YggS family pyridoxal phosphate-dependent enzyme n=1 Tax=Selenobaculum sp. TaxID=3074374 RepID=UPI003AB340E6